MDKTLHSFYKQAATPPTDALKKISGGRIAGKTDINPQWRIEKMTEIYGLCGFGWYYEITEKSVYEGANNEKIAVVAVNVYVKDKEGWSKPIPGTGGSMLVTQEIKGLYTSDEGFKMATTDALSVALKFLGIGADIYRGYTNGGGETTKYDLPPAGGAPIPKAKPKPWLNNNTKNKNGESALEAAEKWMREGGTIEDIEAKYRMNKSIREELLKAK